MAFMKPCKLWYEGFRTVGVSGLGLAVREQGCRLEVLAA